MDGYMARGGLPTGRSAGDSAGCIDTTRRVETPEQSSRVSVRVRWKTCVAARLGWRTGLNYVGCSNQSWFVISRGDRIARCGAAKALADQGWALTRPPDSLGSDLMTIVSAGCTINWSMYRTAEGDWRRSAIVRWQPVSSTASARNPTPSNVWRRGWAAVSRGRPLYRSNGLDVSIQIDV